MRSSTLILAALLATSSTLSASLWQALRSERTLSASLLGQLQGTGARLRTATSKLTDVVAATAAPALPAVSAENMPVAPAPSKGQIDPVAALRHAMLTEQELWKDADYRRERLAQIRSTIAQGYPGLVEELDLDKDETERLFDILAENQMNASAPSIAFAADRQPDPAALAEMARRRHDSQRSLNESLQAMLGSRFALWQAYQPTRTTRAQAMSFSTQLARAGQPLSNTQLKLLTAAMIADRRSPQSTPGISTAGLNPQDPAARAKIEEAVRQRQEESNRRTMDTAALYMNPQQLGIVKAQLEQQLALSRAATRARERVNATK